MVGTNKWTDAQIFVCFELKHWAREEIVKYINERWPRRFVTKPGVGYVLNTKKAEYLALKRSGFTLDDFPPRVGAAKHSVSKHSALKARVAATRTEPAYAAASAPPPLPLYTPPSARAYAPPPPPHPPRFFTPPSPAYAAPPSFTAPQPPPYFGPGPSTSSALPPAETYNPFGPYNSILPNFLYPSPIDNQAADLNLVLNLSNFKFGPCDLSVPAGPSASAYGGEDMMNVTLNSFDFGAAGAGLAASSSSTLPLVATMGDTGPIEVLNRPVAVEEEKKKEKEKEEMEEDGMEKEKDLLEYSPEELDAVVRAALEEWNEALGTH